VAKAPRGGRQGVVGGLGGFFLTPGFVLMNNIAAKAKAKRVPLFFIFFFCGTPQGLISNLHFLTFIYVFKYVRGVVVSLFIAGPKSKGNLTAVQSVIRAKYARDVAPSLNFISSENENCK